MITSLIETLEFPNFYMWSHEHIYNETSVIYFDRPVFSRLELMAFELHQRKRKPP